MKITELGKPGNVNARINLESVSTLEWPGSAGVLPAVKHGILLCGF